MAEGDTKIDSKFQKQLVAALDSPAISGRLAAILKTAISDIDQKLGDYERKINNLNDTIDILRADLSRRDATITALSDSVTKLKMENQSLRAAVDAMELESRRDNLVFTGIELQLADTAADNAEPASSRVMQQVLRICNENLHCETKLSDIRYVQTMKPKGEGANNARGSAIVSFNTRRIRDDVFFSKKKLAETNRNKEVGRRVYINEDLPATQRKLLSNLRQQVKNKNIQGVWTKYCKIYVKKLNNTVKLITSMNDLNE
jgi:chromosome segregation ATPase